MHAIGPGTILWRRAKAGMVMLQHRNQPPRNRDTVIFKGSLPALVTPFTAEGIDEPALVRLVERQIAAGAHGLVPCGTTGEASALSPEEHKRVIALTVATARGRVPVIAGIGGGRLADVIEKMAYAKAAGVDAALAVTPFYVRPSQDGLIAYYQALQNAVALPFIAYNVPSRTGVDMAVETVIAVAQLPNAMGLKDATGDLARVARHLAAVPSDFALLSGDDASAVGFNAQGGVGCISVTANLAPQPFAALQEACLSGDFAAAATINATLSRLHRALFLHPSPAPTKRALAMLGLCQDHVRLPLTATPEGLDAELRAALAEAGL
jgi:4-hydroxy-tetrahydrodipicolinate synthase